MQPISNYHIILPSAPTLGERRAADFLRRAVAIVTGTLLPLAYDGETPQQPYELVVGRTNRAALDGLVLPASREGRDEFTLRAVGDRVYFCGHGLAEEAPVPAVSAYRYYDDGSFGTVCAVYRFVEDALGYHFLHDAPPPRCPNLVLPDDYHDDYTRALLRASAVPLPSGTTLYMLPLTGQLNWNMMSIILRTQAGRLVVIDGGHAEERDTLLSVLRALSPDPERIRIEAWLLTHLHADHFGALLSILRDEGMRERFEIGSFRCNLLEEAFYTTLGRETGEWAGPVWHDLLTLPTRFGARVDTVAEGDEIHVDELRFRALHVPSMADAEQMDINDSSVVWRLDTAGGKSVLFLGDAEFVCSNDLLARHRGELAADIVQVGHHGCGNVAREVYAAAGASLYLWLAGHKFWYSDMGEGLGTHNTGVIRTRAWLDALGVKPEQILRNDREIVALSL